MPKLEHIIDGWRNYFFENEEIKKIATERAAICATCEHSVLGSVIQFLPDNVKEIEGFKCDLCDCPLSSLLRSRESECKLKKWQTAK